MYAALLQKKIYTGYGKAAKRIGYDTEVYRPDSALNPIDPINMLRRLPASFNAEDMKYGKPNTYGQAVWYVLIDGNFTRVGDYLKNNQDGTFFIASQQQALPMLAVECNRQVIVRSAVAPAAGAVGALAYGGLCAATGESTVTLGADPANTGGAFIGWPCSILLGKGKLKVPNPLPGGTGEQMGWMILLPASVPITLNAGDMLTDDIGRKYLVNAAELTDAGWRLMAIEVHA